MILSAKRKGREEEDPKTLTDILIEQMRSIERQDGVQEDEATKHGPVYESLLPERGHSAAVRLHRGRLSVEMGDREKKMLRE